ncbi:MAG: TonB-dependent receptor [Spirochaetales bacterium]|nr:TonB-dependent receptor [Spirochaetales bacterium]
MKRIIIIILLTFVLTAAFADVEIIVTASRIEEDSKTTPAYVRVIPEEEIDKKTTVLDVLKTIPDISVRELSPAKQSISMGGFGDGGFGRTLILINGRPVNRPDMASFDWNSIPLASVSRIEIVKGSMSSQYGDQAVAGVINIITKQPEGLTATVSASVADTLTNNQSVFVSYGNETSGVALGLNRIDNNPTRDRSDYTILSTNIDSFYNFAGIELKVGGYYSNSEYQLPGSLSEAQFDSDPDIANNQEDEGISTNYGVNGSFDITAGAVDLTFPIYYSVLNYSTDMTSWGIYSDTNIATTAAGIKASSSFYIGNSVEITPVGGLDFKHNNLSVTKFDSADRTTQTSETDVIRIDTAAWARAKANYLDLFIFDGGLRYNYSDMNTSPGITHTELVYDMGGVWSITPELRASLRYGRVFRYPFFEEQYEWYSTVNTNLKPEVGNNYNFSIDYTIDNFSITISPYLISLDNEIMWDGSTNVNAGSTIHYGASVESGYSKGIISMNIGYAYDHAEFTETGKIIPLVPEHTIYSSVSVTPLESISISTDARYTSSYYNGGDNDNAQEKIPGRIEWNMRIDWKVMDDISWYASADNILNNRTPVWVFYGGWYPMPGRTFETGIKWVY